MFVAGGLTYSEIRAAYKVSEANNKDVFIGQSFALIARMGIDFFE